MFGWFKKKDTTEPKKPSVSSISIKVNAQHKADDKKKHQYFLGELKELLVFSKLFKKEFINSYMDLYKEYKPFVGRNFNEISKQASFTDSFADTTITKSEMKRLSAKIVHIAESRAYNRVNLERMQSLGITHIKLSFADEQYLCPNTIKLKNKHEGKSMPINKVPLLPLQSCFECNAACHTPATYMSVIKGFNS